MIAIMFVISYSMIFMLCVFIMVVLICRFISTTLATLRITWRELFVRVIFNIVLMVFDSFFNIVLMFVSVDRLTILFKFVSKVIGHKSHPFYVVCYYLLFILYTLCAQRYV